MKIVLDTNVVVSAFFFGGYPRQILEAVMQGRATAYATREIVEEYEAVFAKMKAGKKGKIPRNLLLPFISRLHIVAPKPTSAICRDSGDDKFISCAVAANAIYVVDGHKEISFPGPGRTAKIIKTPGVCAFLSLIK